MAKKQKSSDIKEAKQTLKKKADGKPPRKRRTRIKKIKTKGKTEPKKVAKKTLKDNLKREYQITLTVDGSTKYVAGMIIELNESWGKFEGKLLFPE